MQRFLQISVIVVVLSAGHARTVYAGGWLRHTSPVADDLHLGWFLDDSRGLIVTHSTGTVLATTDGGRTWKVQAKLLPAYYESVFFLDKSRGWICGEKGLIYRSDDGGASWSPMRLGREDLALSGIHFFDRQQGFVVGMNVRDRRAAFLATADGGRSWVDRSAEFPGAGLTSSIAFSNGVGIVGGFRYLFRSGDRGGNWEAYDAGTSVLVRDAVFLNKTTVWAVGRHGLLLYSRDGGRTWEHVARFTDTLLRGVIFLDEKRGFVTGDRDKRETALWQTTDGGESWRSVEGDFPDLHGGMLSPKRAWLVGDAGTILSLER